MTFQLTFSKPTWWLDGTKWAFLDGRTGKVERGNSVAAHLKHSTLCRVSTMRQGRQLGYLQLHLGAVSEQRCAWESSPLEEALGSVCTLLSAHFPQHGVGGFGKSCLGKPEISQASPSALGQNVNQREKLPKYTPTHPRTGAGPKY